MNPKFFSISFASLKMEDGILFEEKKLLDQYLFCSCQVFCCFLLPRALDIDCVFCH